MPGDLLYLSGIYVPPDSVLYRQSKNVAGHTCAMLDEQLHDLQMAILACKMEGRVARVLLADVGVGTLLQQDQACARHAGYGCAMQRRHALVVIHVDIGQRRRRVDPVLLPLFHLQKSGYFVPFPVQRQSVQHSRCVRAGAQLRPELGNLASCRVRELRGQRQVDACLLLLGVVVVARFQRLIKRARHIRFGANVRLGQVRLPHGGAADGARADAHYEEEELPAAVSARANVMARAVGFFTIRTDRPTHEARLGCAGDSLAVTLCRRPGEILVLKLFIENRSWYQTKFAFKFVI